MCGGRRWVAVEVRRAKSPQGTLGHSATIAPTAPAEVYDTAASRGHADGWDNLPPFGPFLLLVFLLRLLPASTPLLSATMTSTAKAADRARAAGAATMVSGRPSEVVSSVAKVVVMEQRKPVAASAARFRL